jgi:hypothetical protein
MWISMQIFILITNIIPLNENNNNFNNFILNFDVWPKKFELHEEQQRRVKKWKRYPKRVGLGMTLKITLILNK